MTPTTAAGLSLTSRRSRPLAATAMAAAAAALPPLLQRDLLLSLRLVVVMAAVAGAGNSLRRRRWRVLQRRANGQERTEACSRKQAFSESFQVMTLKTRYGRAAAGWHARWPEVDMCRRPAHPSGCAAGAACHHDELAAIAQADSEAFV
jgi:hypothetical protein